MDTIQDEKRINQGDRLSSLPGDLIHKILAFNDTIDAIKTSALSSRWRYIWTSMSSLDFSTNSFTMLPKFSKFVTRVFSHRNNLIEVSSLKLSFRGKDSQVFVKRFMNYAFSHNIQQLTVTCLLDTKRTVIPLSLFNSQSLKHLTLTGSPSYKCRIELTSIWELPALTTLYLGSIISYDENIELFPNCLNLKNLTLDCRMTELNGFNICDSRLSRLTLNHIGCNVNVEAPELKYLSDRQKNARHLLRFSEDGAILWRSWIYVLPVHTTMMLIILLACFKVSIM